MKKINQNSDLMIAAKYRNLVRVINESKGNISEAARRFKVCSHTVHRWIREFDVMGADFSELKYSRNKYVRKKQVLKEMEN